jgi:hypothetical protein
MSNFDEGLLLIGDGRSAAAHAGTLTCVSASIRYTSGGTSSIRSSILSSLVPLEGAAPGGNPTRCWACELQISAAGSFPKWACNVLPVQYATSETWRLQKVPRQVILCLPAMPRGLPRETFGVADGAGSLPAGRAHCLHHLPFLPQSAVATGPGAEAAWHLGERAVPKLSSPASGEGLR